jgi:hypothetical protein
MRKSAMPAEKFAKKRGNLSVKLSPEACQNFDVLLKQKNPTKR